MRRLLVDIETAPNLVHVWGLWNQNVGTPQIIAAGYVLCWAAKWYGDNEIMFDSIHQSKPKAMLKKIHTLLSEADAVVHYNGTKFDVPTLNKEFLLHDMTPPAPYKQIDLLKTARRQFRFPSNKLDYIARALEVGQKLPNTGHQLWIDCMGGDETAWRTMEKYNKHDVVLLERVYDRLLPWVRDHANTGLYQDNPKVCPNCASTHFQRRGFAYTSSYRYPRFRCSDCGTWFRGISSRKTDDEQTFRTISG